jgi:hypothetical protein
MELEQTPAEGIGGDSELESQVPPEDSTLNDSFDRLVHFYWCIVVSGNEQEVHSKHVRSLYNVLQYYSIVMYLLEFIILIVHYKLFDSHDFGGDCANL